MFNNNAKNNTWRENKIKHNRSTSHIKIILEIADVGWQIADFSKSKIIMNNANKTSFTRYITTIKIKLQIWKKKTKC